MPGGHRNGKHTQQHPQHARPLPYALEAEESLLGAMLLAPTAIDIALDHGITPSHYSPRHQPIHAAIVTLRANAEPADPVTVAEQLRRTGMLDNIGGSTRLVELQVGTPGTGGAAKYAAIVAEHWQRRRLAQLAAELDHAARDTTQALARLTELAAELAETTHTVGQSPRTILRANTYRLDDLDQLPETEWLITDVLPRTGLAIMWGPSGSYKTFIALDLALRTAAGLHAWGRRTRPSRVLYVAGEGIWGIRQRVNAWRRHNPDAPTDLAEYFEILAYPPPLADEDRTWAVALADHAKHDGADLVVVDTVNRSFGGASENDTADMTRFVAACDLVARTTGGLVLGVHHSGHDKTRMRGNTALYAACDAVLTVTRPTDGWAQLTNAHSAAGKIKDAEEMTQPVTFRLDQVGESLVAVMTDADQLPATAGADQPSNRRKDPTDRLVELAKGLRLLEQTGHPPGVIVSARALADVLGVSPHTATRIIDAALNAGRLTRQGREWHTTEDQQW